MTAPWWWFALGSAVFAALTALLGKVGVAGLPSNLATLIRTLVVIVVTIILITVRDEWRRPATISWTSWMALILSGAATGLSWLCYFRALSMAPLSRVAPLDKLSVALVILFGIVFLGERPSVPHLLGGGLIVLGVLMLACF
ncbi:EamA family transporter [Frateuria aurantia]|uniref:Putative membrane protein n=1 Tax=Frateuria aurantia (strain ATCC 33424 / DSM 6220 / KCTC 2777 / LMG 1558 / NBRC 3245 / NCIMB 13370) TaxID=767434 RepID=H8L220_FRAAD|nr:EamA family transporter [Frateuria aurantia]AFC87275.1 putative membrane protein [Frateuria aurantia DSM 6220]